MRSGSLWIWAWVCLTIGCSVACADEVTVAGRTVTVETARYRVAFDGLCLVRVENRLTGETYAAPPAEAAGKLALSPLATRTGIAIDSMRPAAPVKYYTLCDRTTVASEKTAAGANITYTGLQCGDDFAPAMQYLLKLTVEPKTGDLLITPEAHGNIAPVFDSQVSGVYRDALQVRNLHGDLRLVLPVDRGVAYTKENTPAAWSEKPVTWRWPQQWEAALLIAEGAKGCLGLWADEPKLQYTRNLALCRSTEQWQVALEYETMDMNYRCEGITGATWRFNVFTGNWLQAAARYRAQMRSQWPDLQPLSAQTPAWADHIRVVMGPALPDADAASLLATLPRDTTAIAARNGWAYDNGKNTPLRENLLWPPALLWHYALPKDLPARVAVLEGQGIHVFAYANHNICGGIGQAHPYGWEPWDRAVGSYLTTWRFWRRLFPEACRDLVKQTGAGGIWEGYSWVMRRHIGNEPAGENWYTGSLGMRAYFHEILPQTALMGELTNEVTCRGQQLALSVDRDPRAAHPIDAYLFGDTVRQWSETNTPQQQEADDIRGDLTYWPANWNALPPAQQSYLQARGTLFAREQLTSVWPDKWDAQVLHYYQAKDGTPYRLLRDQGTRLVKGKDETIYWRVSGVREAETPGYAIPGWVAYDGTRAIGLNPVETYLTTDGVTPPPAVISALPAGATITRTLNGDGYWLVTIAQPKADPIASTIRVRGKGLSFSGTDGVKALPNDAYDVTVTLPGSFAAYWKDPDDVPLLKSMTHQPWQLAICRQSGLETARGAFKRKADALFPDVGQAEYDDEGTLSLLVKLPADQLYLAFQFGSGVEAVSDGVNYRVRVNGRTLWERHRDEVSLKPKEPPVIATGAVDLSDYAGKTVVLELSADGGQTGLGDIVRWGSPQVSGLPPKDADMNKPAATPESTEADPEKKP